MWCLTVVAAVKVEVQIEFRSDGVWLGIVRARKVTCYSKCIRAIETMHDFRIRYVTTSSYSKYL